jgi:hypothetical protein
MLMSITSAPDASASRAASASQRASQPANWTMCGTTPSPSARSRVSSWPLTNSSDATISETT